MKSKKSLAVKLTAIVGILIFAMGLAGLSLASEQAFMAGAAKVDITPDPAAGEYWLGGYAPARMGKSIHDHIFARCLAVKTPDQDIVLVSVDSTGILGSDIEPYRDAIQERTGISRDKVFIFATHSHSAVDLFGLYGGVPKSYLDEQPGNMALCVAEAVNDLKPAVMRVATIEAPDLNGNRRHENRLPADPEAGILRFETPDGQVIATAVNYACHPVTFPREDTAIGADYVWALNRTLEEKGGVGLFFQGAAGNINPEFATLNEATGGGDGYALAEYLGSELAGRLLLALDKAETVEAMSLASAIDRFEVKIDNPPFKFLMMSGKIRMKPRGGKLPAEIGVITLGPVRIVSIPGELFTEQGMDLKSRLGGEYNFVFTFGNGYIGYMPTKADWSTDGYEETLAISPNIEDIVSEHFSLALGQ